jgi:uncharacterized protein with PQ loop repeat
MKFEIMDDNVSMTMNVFIIIANIINIVYNIPQMVKTYQRKTTQDLSSWFIFLRIIGNSIWIGYAIEVDSMMMLINTIVTVGSSVFIAYYKVLELYKERFIIEDNKKLLDENENEDENDNEDENEDEDENKNEIKFNYNNYQNINNDDILYEV